jgi:hypothetical protein
MKLGGKSSNRFFVELNPCLLILFPDLTVMVWRLLFFSYSEVLPNFRSMEHYGSIPVYYRFKRIHRWLPPSEPAIGSI